jgi:tellurite resistance protein
MEELLGVELTEAQSAGMGRAMLAVARSDGKIDPRERALIEQLAPVPADAPEPDPAELAALFPGTAERELVLRSVLLVALADRSYTDTERAVVLRIAKGLGVGETRVTELASEVKAYLFGSLLKLANSDVVAEASGKLKI